jgi:hypothetical protein
MDTLFPQANLSEAGNRLMLPKPKSFPVDFLQQLLKQPLKQNPKFSEERTTPSPLFQNGIELIDNLAD